MIFQSKLYIEDIRELRHTLYRMAFGDEPLFPERRVAKDILVQKIGDHLWVRANGNGFSGSTRITSAMRLPGRRVFRLSAGCPIPKGLLISKDLRPGHEDHFMIAPAYDMLVSEFITLIEKISSNLAYCAEVSRSEVANAR